MRRASSSLIFSSLRVDLGHHLNLLHSWGYLVVFVSFSSNESTAAFTSWFGLVWSSWILSPLYFPSVLWFSPWQGLVPRGFWLFPISCERLVPTDSFLDCSVLYFGVGVPLVLIFGWGLVVLLWSVESMVFGVTYPYLKIYFLLLLLVAPVENFVLGMRS